MTMKLNPSEFGPKLTEVRKQAGLTRFQLARRAGVDAHFLARLESGDHQPTLEVVDKLSHALGVRPERFGHHE